MSFLHSHSEACLKTELDLFSLPPTQTAIDSSKWVYYKPISSLNDESPIEFCISAQSDDYLDLAHTMLKLSVSITPYVKDKDLLVAPVNNFLHSMFSQVDVSFNQKVVSPPNHCYAYRAYLETLLNYGPAAKASHLSTTLWISDVAGEMDAVPKSEQNQSMTGRQGYFLGGKSVDLLGHLHCDVFNQDRFLLNGVEVRLRLVRAKDAFCLMDVSDQNHSVHINEATLLIRRVKLNPAVLIAHAKTLATTPAKYPITRVEVKTFTLHKGIQNECLDNVILGQLPKRVIIGFVDNEAFNGNKKLNPFNFQNYSINFLSLYVNGEQIPSQPLTPKFTGDSPQYIESYHTIFSGTGLHYMNEGNDIDRDDYPKGYCLFCFDLTPDMSAHFAGHWNLVKNGTVRIEVRFENALAKTINCILYAEFDNILEVDSSRQVMVDYNS